MIYLNEIKAMKILLLIACVLFSVLSIFGINPSLREYPYDSEGNYIFTETNYPANMRMMSRYVLTGCFFDAMSFKPSLEWFYAVAQSNYNSGLITDNSLKMIRTICDQIEAGEVERGKYFKKYIDLKKLDTSTEGAKRRVDAKVKSVQKQWDAYATSARAEIETNIQELTRLLKNP